MLDCAGQVAAGRGMIASAWLCSSAKWLIEVDETLTIGPLCFCATAKARLLMDHKIARICEARGRWDVDAMADIQTRLLQNGNPITSEMRQTFVVCAGKEILILRIAELRRMATDWRVVTSLEPIAHLKLCSLTLS